MRERVKVMTFDPAQRSITQASSQESRQAETDVGQEAHQDLAVDGFPGASVELAQAVVLLAFTVTNLDIPAELVDPQDIEGGKVQVRTHQYEPVDDLALAVEFFSEDHLHYTQVFHSHPTRQKAI